MLFIVVTMTAFFSFKTNALDLTYTFQIYNPIA